MENGYYERVMANDCFEDNNNGLEFGINFGEWHPDIKEMGDSYGSEWFASEKEREDHIIKEVLTDKVINYENIDTLQS